MNRKKTMLWKGMICLLALLCSTALQAQDRKVSGTILSQEDNNPLAGVTVTVKGKKRVTQTQPNGTFVILAQKGDQLLFTYTGFISQEWRVGDNDEASIKLKPDVSKLGEVVVVGYGKQSRQTLSGAVTSLDQNALKSSPSTNVATALQGTMPGLKIQQSTGQPGTTPSISFRGGTDFNGGGSPMVVMDGVIVPSLYGINMDDVESIDLLKDAASTAIYGARASNGVILVTTKKGKKGKAQVNYSFRQTTNYIRRNPLEYLTAAQYISKNREGIASRYQADLADGNNSAAATDRGQNLGSWGWAVNNAWTTPIGLYSTQLVSAANRKYIGNPQWGLLIDPNPFIAGQMDSILYRSLDVKTRENMILQQQTTQEHYLNLSGANEQGSFSLGLGMAKDNGIIIGSSLKRLSMNFNGGLNVGKNLKVSMSTSAYTVSQLVPYVDPAGGGAGGLMQRFIGVAPTVRYTNDTSGAVLPGPNDNTLGNPNYWSQLYNNNSSQQRITGSLNIEYSILPSLKFLASGSGYLLYNNANAFTKAYQQGNGGAFNTTRPASFSNYNDVQYSYNAFLQYDKSFGNHKLSVLGGGEFYEFTEKSFSASASGAPTDLIPWLYASLPASVVNGVIQNPVSASSDFNAWDRLTSAIGRVNYSYLNKYFLTANFRYDGSSRLANNRFGLFPGVSAGWNMHKEDFFEKSFLSKYINVLKPRVSWGQNGSINPLGYYATAQVYSSAGIYNGLGGTYAPSYINTDLKWEKASTFDVGVDIGILNNRVTLIADYFVRDVYDKIASLPISAQTGFTSFTTNLGQLRNKGLELEVKAKIIKPVKADGLSVDVSANFYTFKNYVVKLPYNGLPGNRQSTIQVWDSNHPGQLMQVAGLQEGSRVGTDEIWAPSYSGIYRSAADLSKDASVYNAFMPYIHKNLHQLGDAMWNQVYKNDTIDSRQFTYVGRSVPNILGGFSTMVGYKGFSLYAQFDYALNFMILNNEKLRGLSQVQGSQNSTVDALKTWSPTNPNGTLPRFYWANQGRNYATDASGNNPFKEFWEKGDYLALRELTLSYDMTPALLRKALNNKVHNLRLFATGSNLFYLTQYSGNFPEVGGVDNGKFPLPRRLTLGVNITL